LGNADTLALERLDGGQQAAVLFRDQAIGRVVEPVGERDILFAFR
jgi:hypothetical protein